MKVVLRGKFIAINDYIKKKEIPQMEKEDNTQEQMDNISRKIETLRKNPKEMLKTSNTVTEIKNTFDGLIKRLGSAKERFSELEKMSIGTYKTEKE